MPTADNQPTKWEVTAAPAAIFIAADIIRWLKLSDSEDTGDIDLAISAATDFAEGKLGAALMQQTIRATFYDGEELRLPRTPLVTISAITDQAGNAVTDYVIRHAGRSTWIEFTRSVLRPATVVYVAGYANAAAIPAAIRHAIRSHVGTMLANRESVGKADLKGVPQGLEDFYRLHSRRTGIG